MDGKDSKGVIAWVTCTNTISDEPVWLMVTNQSGKWTIPGGGLLGGYDESITVWSIVDEALREMKAVLGPSAIGNPVAIDSVMFEHSHVVWIEAEEIPLSIRIEDSHLSSFLQSHDPNWGEYCWCIGVPDDYENLQDFEMVRKLLNWSA
jgi:hypothetical protein